MLKRQEATQRRRYSEKTRKGECKMNREFLRSLGLGDEVVESIMAKHGSTIKELNDQLGTQKSKAETLEEQITKRDTDLKTLREQLKDHEGANTELEALQTKYNEETQKLQEQLEHNKKMNEIRLAINKSGARNEKAILALLDLEEVKVNDDGVQGLKEQLETLKVSDNYLFEAVENKKPNIVAGGNPQGAGSGTLTREQIMQEKDSIKRQTLISENPELFR